MQRERLLRIEKRWNQPENHEAERHDELDDGEDPSEPLLLGSAAVSTPEPDQDHRADDGPGQHHPVQDAVRHEGRSSHRRIHVSNARGRSR